MDIIKSIKSWKPRNGFQRKTKSLQHGQQQQNLKTIRRMNNDAENEFVKNEEPILNNVLFEPPNTVQPEYWVNESCSSNASITHLPINEELLAGSVSSSITSSSSRTATTLPNGIQPVSMFQHTSDAGNVICGKRI